MSSKSRSPGSVRCATPSLRKAEREDLPSVAALHGTAHASRDGRDCKRLARSVRIGLFPYWTQIRMQWRMKSKPGFVETGHWGPAHGSPAHGSSAHWGPTAG